MFLGVFYDEDMFPATANDKDTLWLHTKTYEYDNRGVINDVEFIWSVEQGGKWVLNDVKYSLIKSLNN